MKRYNVLNIMIISCLCLNLGFLIPDCIAQDKATEKKIERTVKTMKSRYVTVDKKAVNMSWAPAKDPNVKTNMLYCRSKNGPKVETIGTLVCKDQANIGYTITKAQNGVKLHLIYSTLTGNLSKFYIESMGARPVRKYLYTVKYPTATLQKVAIYLSDESMMAFDPSGRLNVFVYDNKTSCKTENNAGQIVDSPNARTLCKQIVEAQF
jgi:hypothetical protein